MKDAPAQPINRPHYKNVIATPHRMLQQSVECGTLISDLGPADAMILVRLDDATMSFHPCKDETLVCRGLIVTANRRWIAKRSRAGRLRRSYGVGLGRKVSALCGTIQYPVRYRTVITYLCYSREYSGLDPLSHRDCHASSANQSAMRQGGPTDRDIV